MHPYELLGEARGLIASPFIVEPRPENLVVGGAIDGTQRAPQQAFGGRAELVDRGIAARVPCGDSGFEPVHAERLEGKAEDQAAGVLKQPLAPPGRARARCPTRRC